MIQIYFVVVDLVKRGVLTLADEIWRYRNDLYYNLFLFSFFFPFLMGEWTCFVYVACLATVADGSESGLDTDYCMCGPSHSIADEFHCVFKTGQPVGYREVSNYNSPLGDCFKKEEEVLIPPPATRCNAHSFSAREWTCELRA